jgi:Ca-activated chloride channel homolog
MQFLWPEMLWCLLALPLLVAAYILALRRKNKAAVRYASLSLIRDAIGPAQRWRRHLPPLLFLFAIAAAIIVVARPTASLTLPSESLTIALAMDVSLSMRATDVQPDRITAAQSAARSFVEDLPKTARLGIVTFAGTAALVQTPTEDKVEMLAAIDRFKLQRGTATGSGLLYALAMLFPDDGIELDSIAPGRSRAGGVAIWQQDKNANTQDSGGGAAAVKKPFKPVPPGTYQSGAIILLSDGRRTTGPDPLDAAKLAADRGVRVYTVGFGTQNGGEITVDGMSFYTRLDEETLKAIAAVTKGEYFHADSATSLKSVYETLTSKFALERRQTEVGSLFSAAAALLLLLAGALSMVWFYRGNPAPARQVPRATQ